MSWFRNILSGSGSDTNKSCQGSQGSSLSSIGRRGFRKKGSPLSTDDDTRRKFVIDNEDLEVVATIRELTEYLVQETTRIRRSIQVEMRQHPLSSSLSLFGDIENMAGDIYSREFYSMDDLNFHFELDFDYDGEEEDDDDNDDDDEEMMINDNEVMLRR